MMTFPSRMSLDRPAQQLTLRRLFTVRQAQSNCRPLNHPNFLVLDQIIEGVIDLDPHYQRGV